MKKKIISAILCMTMVISMFAGMQGTTVLASGMDADDYCADVAQYRTGEKEDWTYPTKEGYVFAGWYTKKDFQQKYALTDTMVSGGAYAKFVDEDVLSVKYQMNTRANIEDVYTSLRMLTSVDDLAYQSVGFRFQTGATSVDFMKSTVYTSIKANGIVFEPKTAFSENSNYIVGHALNKIPKAHYGSEFTITPVWVTLDGTTVEGVERSFTIKEDYTVAEDQTKSYSGSGDLDFWFENIKIRANQWISFDLEGVSVDKAASVRYFVKSGDETKEEFDDAHPGTKFHYVSQGDKIRFYGQVYGTYTKCSVGIRLSEGHGAAAGTDITVSNLRITAEPENKLFYNINCNDGGYFEPNEFITVSAKTGQILSYKVALQDGRLTNGTDLSNLGSWIRVNGNTDKDTVRQAYRVFDNAEGTQTVEVKITEDLISFKPTFDIKDIPEGVSETKMVIYDIQVNDALYEEKTAKAKALDFDYTMEIAKEATLSFDVTSESPIAIYIYYTGQPVSEIVLSNQQCQRGTVHLTYKFPVATTEFKIATRNWVNTTTPFTVSVSNVQVTPAEVPSLELPEGYYAVQQGDSSFFTYKGIVYSVENDINVFDKLSDALASANKVPDEVIEGLDYQEFDTPVILFSSGEHHVHDVILNRAITLLGQSAGVNPNSPLKNIEDCPELNYERELEESVFYGNDFWGPNMTIKDSNIDLKKIIIDGFSWREVTFLDQREEGSSTEYIFRNIIHLGPSPKTVYDFTPVTEESALQREVYFENLRVCDFDDSYDQSRNFVLLNAKKAIFSGICTDNTSQVFGLSNIAMTYPNYAANADTTEITIRDSYFGNLKRYNGLSVSAYGIDTSNMTITIDNCDFYNASHENESAINARLENDNCSLKVQNCRFVDTRGNDGEAIHVSGVGTDVLCENNEYEGYSTECTTSIIPSAGPDYINNQEGVTDSEDSHQVLSFDESDFSEIHDIYKGTQAYYGDLHAHFYTAGGTNDGQTALSNWTAGMDAIGLDFVVLTDHKQRRGPFTEWWDASRFIAAAEPNIHITDLDGAIKSDFHVNMIFPDEKTHAKVMQAFPEFNWQGDNMSGSLTYPNMTKARAEELAAFVKSVGGLFAHAHPKQTMGSTNPLDYYYGEYTYMDVLYEYCDSNSSFANYDLWVELLNRGKRIYASTNTDTHYEVRNDVVSTFYTEERHGSVFFNKMKSGDYTAGAVGMKMFIDSSPMGSSVEYREGQKLFLEIDDFYESAWKENTTYELRIYTDQGLAYSSIFNGSKPQNLVLKVQDRMYYRAEIVDVTNGYRVAIGNPIWLD